MSLDKLAPHLPTARPANLSNGNQSTVRDALSTVFYVMHVRDQVGLDVHLTESEHNDGSR